MKKSIIIVLIILLGSALVIIPNMKGSTDNSFGQVEVSNKNLAMPDLSSATDLGGGLYRLFNDYGVAVDYNINSGIWTINGTLIAPTSFDITNFIEAGTKTLSYVYVDGSFDQSNILFNVAPEFNSIVRVWNYNYTTNAQNTATQTVNTTIYIQFVGIATFDNFQFKLQLEKGSQATSYVVPKTISVYQDNLTYKEKQDIGIGAFTGITNIIKTIDNVITPITDMFNTIIDFFN